MFQREISNLSNVRHLSTTALSTMLLHSLIPNNLTLLALTIPPVIAMFDQLHHVCLLDYYLQIKSILLHATQYIRNARSTVNVTATTATSCKTSAAMNAPLPVHLLDST